MSFLKPAKSKTESEKINAFQATVCEFGVAVPALYGRCKTTPNLINYQDFTAEQNKKTSKSGKAKSTQISYLYSAYLELALGTPIERIESIWVGNDKYNSLAALNGAGSDVAGQPLSVNIGDNNQPTVYMSSKHPTEAVGYENLSYLYGYVFLGEDNASCPSYQVEVQGALGGVNYGGDGIDANPAYIIKDILEQLGLGNYIDAPSFQDFALYCKQADLLVSTPSGKFNQQRKTQEIVKELLDLSNTYMYWDGKFVFVPRESVPQGSWQPNTTILYDLDAKDLALNDGGIVSFQRKDSNEIYNYVTVKFTNRSNDYEEETVSYQNIDDVRVRGVHSIEIDATWIHTKERAIKFARAYARKCQSEINKYTLKLDWSKCLLTPGSLIRVTDETLGIAKQVMMVSEITEDRKGLLTVVAIQRDDIPGAEPIYSVIDDYNTLDFNRQPSNTAEPVFISPPAELVTGNGVELWIALRGENDENEWGGCEVYVSDKDGSYTYDGLQTNQTSMGYPRNSINNSTTQFTVQFYNKNVINVDMGAVDEPITTSKLLWIDGEIIGYERAYLNSTKNRYTFYGIDKYRGLYGTEKKNHAYSQNVKVVLLDSNLYALPLPNEYAGKTLYFKFPAVNVFQKNVQSLADIDSYNTVIVNNAKDLGEGYVRNNYLSSNYYTASTTNDVVNEAVGEAPDYWDFVVESYQSNDKKSWYRLHRSGWCEQGGETISTTSDALEVTLVKPFVDANYYVNWLVNGTTNDGSFRQCVDRYNTHFVLKDYTLNNTSANWYACGYALIDVPTTLNLNVTKASDNPVQTITTVITVDGASTTVTGNQTNLAVPYGATVKVYTGKNNGVSYEGQKWFITKTTTGNIIYNGSDTKAVNFQFRMTEDANITTTIPDIYYYVDDPYNEDHSP